MGECFRYLQPTAVPEHPEPPGGLVAFLWHFARQAKWLFAALFVVEFFVALTDSAVPWVMGRIVTLVTRVPPDLFLAETWPWLLGMALVVLVARPTTALVRYLISDYSPIGIGGRHWQSWQISLCGQPIKLWKLQDCSGPPGMAYRA